MLTIIFSVVCAAVVLTVVLIGYRNKKPVQTISADLSSVQSFDTLGEAVECAGFSMQCSDRLNRILATSYSADRNAIIVNYGTAGYISKTLIMEDAEEGETAQAEAAQAENAQADGENLIPHEINGMTVRFTGEDNAVSQAEWTYNGFDYVISLADQTVTADAMTDYILATR
ncbi:MAG: hypothetical protein IJK23_13185 [Clostridia bacterium]|nr:hypothetical protein [Clostridia bacterium]